jgi:hypothetical protein
MSEATAGERDELLEALASADPVDLGAVPAPDRALFEEIIMETSVTEPTKSNRHRTIVAAAVLVAAAGIGGGAVALSGNDSKAADPPATEAPTDDSTPGKVAGIEPAPRTGQRAGDTIASCMVWDAAIVLPDVEYAFDGTVSAIDDGWVTFEVGEWFSEPRGDLVVLNAESLIPRADGDVVTSVDEQLITEVGQRFLVSGSDGFAGVCNLTQAYAEAEAAVWRSVLA